MAAVTQDPQSKAMLFDGASISQLATLFKKDKRDVTKQIAGLRACGKRQGNPIWHVREAAQYLVEPIGDIEEKIKRMHHRDLPPMLLKEFWNGQNARLKFEEEQGDLWRTDKVLEHYATAFKALRTEILLMADAVDRTAELSDRQREIIREMTDGLLKNLRKTLVDQFKNEPDRNFDDERASAQAGGESSDSSGSEESGDFEDPAAGL